MRVSRRGTWRRAVAVAVLAAVGTSACGGGAGGDREAFCDSAGDQVEAFRSAEGRISPDLVTTVRELSVTAPDELTEAFNSITELSNEEEADAAVSEIKQYLTKECGLDLQR